MCSSVCSGVVTREREKTSQKDERRDDGGGVSIISKGGFVYAGGALEEVVTLSSRKDAFLKRLLSFLLSFSSSSLSSLHTTRSRTEILPRRRRRIQSKFSGTSQTGESRTKQPPKASYTRCARGQMRFVLFSIEVDENGRLEKLDRLPSALNLERLKNAKKRFECEIHVAIGGSSRTNGFAKATSTKAMRKEFVKSVSSFLYEQYEDIFDGIDLNWSYPNDETEWRNLGKFAKALKKDFREHDRTKKISIAYYPNENQEQILEMLECSEFADGLHAMAYDLDDRDGHANLKFATQTLNYAQDSFTGGKIMRLGVPFYGRSIPEDASTAPEWRPYGDVLRDNEYELKDETNVAKSKDGVEVWFNGKDLIRKKVEMCRLFEDVCEGIFVWELGQDVSMSDIEDDEEEEGNSKKIDFRTRREKSLLAALTRAAWGDEKYDEMLAKEMQFYEEDEKKRKKNAEKEEEKKDEL